VRARNDLDLYEERADRWWSPGDRTFRSLRSVGAFHLGLIERQWRDELPGARVVELGCGGGALAIELASRGASVTGIDLSPSSVEAASAEARRRGVDARFLRGNLLACPLPGGSFDLAVLTDVLEHVTDPAAALREVGRLLRPGGLVFLNTFDRTWLSRLVVVDLAEGLGLVPRGTHDPRLFVRPDELRRYAEAGGLVLERLVRERADRLRTALTWTVHLREARRGPGFSAFLRKVAS